MDLNPPLLLGMMLHATGDMRSKHRTKIPWRNHYVANKNSQESQGWLFLVGLGMANAHPSSPLTGGDDFVTFSVTPAGVAFLKVYVKSRSKGTGRKPAA
jgi:hypothetical protein